MSTTDHVLLVQTPSSLNTMVAWNLFKRPIAAAVIAAQLSLVLQPLSVLAQDKGAAPFNPAAQSQLQRLGQWSQDLEKAKAQSAKDKASPADQVSDHLKQADEIIKGLRTTGGCNTSLQFSKCKSCNNICRR